MNLRTFYIVGGGVFFPKHLTSETADILAKAEIIFSNYPTERLHLLPDQIADKAVSFWSLYKDGRRRTENYSDVIKRVVGEAEAFKKVAWLTRGHPVVFDSVTTGLLKTCRDLGWNVVIAPAISSIDTLLADLEYEPASGLVICEATNLVAQNITLNRDVASMILQPGAFQCNIARLTVEHKPLDLSGLSEYLIRFYSNSQRCAFVISADDSFLERRIHWTTLNNITDTAEEHIRGSTLFIPPEKWQQ